MTRARREPHEARHRFWRKDPVRPRPGHWIAQTHGRRWELTKNTSTSTGPAGWYLHTTDRAEPVWLGQRVGSAKIRAEAWITHPETRAQILREVRC